MSPVLELCLARTNKTRNGSSAALATANVRLQSRKEKIRQATEAVKPEPDATGFTAFSGAGLIHRKGRQQIAQTRHLHDEQALIDAGFHIIEEGSR